MLKILYVVLILSFLSSCSMTRPDKLDNEMYACMDKGGTLTTIHIQGIKSDVTCEKIK